MRIGRIISYTTLVLIIYLSLFAFPIISHASAPSEQEERWEQVAGFYELVEKLEAMKTTGGNIQLTEDIVVGADVDYTFSVPQLMNTPIKLDTGDYSIIVQGKLALTPGIEIFGTGGEKGLFLVQDGGWLELYSISIKAASGIAIAQAPRSVLCYGMLFEGMPEFVCEGEIVGVGAVAVPWSATNPNSLQYIYVRDGQRAEDLLPGTDDGTLYENGKMNQNHNLDVAWDIDFFKEKFAARENCMATGRYAFATAYATPVCAVVFQNGRAVTVLGGWGTGGTDGRELSARIQVALEKPQEVLRIDWSADGENWKECEVDMLEEQDGRQCYALYPPEGVGYPFYISAVVIENGEERCSNTLVLRAPNTVGDMGGNRGGGTDVVDPEAPEETDSPDVKPTGNTRPPAQPTTVPTFDPNPFAQPSAGNAGEELGEESESVQGKDTKKIADKGVSQTAAPQVATAATQQQAEGGLDTEQKEQTLFASTSATDDTVTVELSIEKRNMQPEQREDTTFQIVLGSIISCGVIALAVTWRDPMDWVKRLREWFKRATHK